jgi:hypothetical protein
MEAKIASAKVDAVTPILVPVKQACTIIGRCQSALYELIGDGKIRAVKSDGRTLVVVASLHEYATSLPPAKLAPSRKRTRPFKSMGRAAANRIAS